VCRLLDPGPLWSVWDSAGMAHSHYAYLETEALIGTTLELIERPVERMPPERVHPPFLPDGPP